MSKFLSIDLIGQWSNSNWTLNVLEDKSIKLKWKDNSFATGYYKVFDNFMILNYSNNIFEKSWTGRIESLSRNKLILTDLSNDIGQREEMKRTFFGQELIKKFKFTELHGLTISEIKNFLNIAVLHLNTIKSINGTATGLYRHWENDDRFAVNLDRDLVRKIKDNSEILLSINTEIKIAKLGYFTNFTITEDVIEDGYDYTDISERSYEKYNGAYGFDDFTIDSAFDGDPENYWNID